MKSNHKRVPKNKETLAMYQRFIQAFEDLIETGKMKSKNIYCQKVGLNRVRINGIKNLIIKGDSAYQTLASEAIMYLCRDFDISPEWILFGKGDMYENKKSD